MFSIRYYVKNYFLKHSNPGLKSKFVLLKGIFLNGIYCIKIEISLKKLNHNMLTLI